MVRKTKSNQNMNMHPLVEKTRKSIDLSYINRGCIRGGRGALDIRVGPNSLDRALNIMDLLIKKLSEKGVEVTLNEKDYKIHTCVTITEETFAIDIYEKINIIKKGEDKFGYGEYDYIPSGTLVLRIKDAPGDIQSEWKDGKRKKLEDQIDSFIEGLYKAADKEKELDRERQKWHEEYLKKEEEKKTEEQEHERFKILEKEALSWHTSKVIRAYVEDATRAYIQKHGNIEPGGEFDKWKTWASEQANRLDPLSKV
jgi:hypothetical protein